MRSDEKQIIFCLFSQVLNKLITSIKACKNKVCTFKLQERIYSIWVGNIWQFYIFQKPWLITMSSLHNFVIIPFSWVYAEYIERELLCMVNWSLVLFTSLCRNHFMYYYFYKSSLLIFWPNLPYFLYEAMPGQTNWSLVAFLLCI